MTRSSLLLILTCVCALAVRARAASHDEILPAGTLLHCTMDEPNFSSKTAQAGDPVLCHLGPISTFGHSEFPRGAMLSGHLQDSTDPGHFVGKGWLQLEFDRIILPGAEVLPLSAKIIATPHLKTDRDGKIKGGGHPKRDVVEWMIPVLWPIKLITLPARGPYPALKGETRLSMRLMEDVIVPAPVNRASVPSPPWVQPTKYIPSPYGLLRPASLSERSTFGDPPVQGSASPDVISPDSPTYVEQMEQVPAQRWPDELRATPQPSSAADPSDARSTLVVLKGGSAFLAREYWVQSGQLQCISEAGEHKSFALDSVDLFQTVRVNRERNVEFVLHTKDGVVEQ
ncbi:MAG TPA: hypothetical protein VK466_09325 [Terriglobales bacterium]|nr:hypothetical protein [Terriglobales bacterium]